MDPEELRAGRATFLDLRVIVGAICDCWKHDFYASRSVLPGVVISKFPDRQQRIDQTSMDSLQPCLAHRY